MDRDTVFRMMRHLLSPVVTKAVAAAVVGCTLLVSPTQARAQDPAPPPPAAAAASAGALGQGFGEQGQIVISNEGFFGFDKTNNVGWGLTLKPAADYFIMPAISAGLVVAYFKGSGDPGLTTVGVGARGGFNLNLTENLGIWGKLGVTYQHFSAGNASASTTWIALFVPVMYHLLPHLFVGLAPYYNLKIAGEGDHNYGFSYVIGGWF